MAKKRFRAVKQEKLSRSKKEKDDKKASLPPLYYASASYKMKAFITDAFFLLIPILFIVFYFVLEGRDDFAANRVMGWTSILIPFIIMQTLFFYFGNGQTPGYRNYAMKLIDAKTKKQPSLFVIVFRNITAILSLFSIFGWLIMFFRKDSKTLHDLLTATEVVYTNDNDS